jgi:hypothetical protein
MTPTIAALAIVLGSAHPEIQAPEPGAPARAQRVLGEVTSADVEARRINLRTDAGDPIAVVADDKTSFLRAQPGARDLTGATPVTLPEIAAGDRLLARGILSDDKKTLAARQVVVMSRADIAQKQEQERAEWRRRGISGVVKAIGPAAREITVETSSLMWATARPMGRGSRPSRSSRARSRSSPAR